MPSLPHTERFVGWCFRNRVDKGGEPYVLHCVRVMLGLPSEASDDERHAALLHDVLEDTSVTADDLRQMGYSARTVGLVEALTRPNDQPYAAYIAAIAGSGDPGLIAIKLADNADNSDVRRLARLDPDVRMRLQQRYDDARRILLLAARTIA